VEKQAPLDGESEP